MMDWEGKSQVKAGSFSMGTSSLAAPANKESKHTLHNAGLYFKDTLGFNISFQHIMLCLPFLEYKNDRWV